jgi:hypothetical protein
MKELAMWTMNSTPRPTVVEERRKDRREEQGREGRADRSERRLSSRDNQETGGDRTKRENTSQGEEQQREEARKLNT